MRTDNDFQHRTMKFFKTKFMIYKMHLCHRNSEELNVKYSVLHTNNAVV